MIARSKPSPNKIVANDPDDRKGTLKRVGGSESDNWNNTLANQTLNTLWVARSDDETRSSQYSATVSALVGIRPNDELESMLAAQLIAAHNAAMECYRRAMLAEQTLDGRRENLTQANKLSRTYATLLEALNRHRGKGQQKVTVEHVHVHAGGQAVVGSVERSKVNDRPQLGDASHAKQIALTPESPLWRTDTERERVPSPSNAERPVPHARGKITRSSEGQ